MKRIEIELPDSLAHLNDWEIKKAMEKILKEPSLIENLIKGKDPCKIPKEDIKGKKISLLHEHLYLSDFFESLVSYRMKDLYIREGYDLKSKEDLITVLCSRELLENKKEEVEEAINNVLEYEERIRAAEDAFIFTYYQFFAVLFTELFFLLREEIEEQFRKYLKSYAKRRGLLLLTEDEIEAIKQKPELVFELLETRKNDTKLCELREFLQEGKAPIEAINSVLGKAVESFETYLNSPFQKLAYYLATGSGKTYITLVNYWQARKYLKHLNSVCLIVPNADLGSQHKRFSEKFGLSVDFLGDTNGNKKAFEAVGRLLRSEDYDLKLITIHQLASFFKKYEEPQLENAIVLVDEGHKGGEKGWREYRDKLAGDKGFTFEYSATFAQAVKTNIPLIREYSKSIIFAYPYHKFHSDGYGKTPLFFPQEKVRSIVDAIYGRSSIKGKLELKDKELFELFVENILRHYAQVKYYFEHKGDEEFNKRFKLPLNLFVVHKVKGEDSDVRRIYEWFNRFVSDQERINVLEIIERKKEDIPELSEMPKEEIFKEIVKDCLRGNSFDGLSVKAWKINNSEIGFSLNKGERYFAIVYVGNAGDVSIDMEDDNLTSSYMENFLANPDESELQFLIVARKLIEGFDTLRINSISLVDIGKEEGSLVVQLFGRGVRLRGSEEEPLKREGKHPPMEKLNIFGYDAEYLRKFIQEEEMYDIADEETYRISIRFVLDESGKELFRGKRVPVVATPFEESDELVSLEYDEKLVEKVLKKFSKYMEENESGLSLMGLVRAVDIYAGVVDALKFPNLVIAYKEFERVFRNVFHRRYRLKAPSLNRSILEKLARRFMVEYCKEFYRRKKREYENENVVLKELSEEDLNLSFTYEISVPRNTDVSQKVFELVRKLESFDGGKSCFLELKEIDGKPLAIYVKRHVYYPLICKLEDYNVRVSPDRLEPSEVRFLEVVCKFLNDNEEYSNRLVVLRNQRLKGVGFDGFYPDFILWYEDEKEIEHIIFVDPKGMTANNVREVISKAELAVRIKELEEKIGDDGVRLHSFILLNHPLEEYIKNKNIRDSINNIFAQNILGEIREFDDKELLRLLEYYNVIHLGDDPVKAILERVSDKGFEEKLKGLFEYLRSVYLKDSRLAEFIREWQEIEKDDEKALRELKKKYDICPSAIKKNEVLALFLIRTFKGEEEYEKNCKDLTSLKNLLAGCSDIKDSLLEYLLPETIASFVPLVKPASKIVKKFMEYHKRLKEAEKQNFRS